VRTAGWAGSACTAGCWLAGDGGAFSKLHAIYGQWAWLARRCLAVNGGAFSTLLWQSELRASSDGILATKSERKMLASTCSYSLYAWFTFSIYP